MKVEFRQGVPEGCTEWLNTHVGKGNITGFVDVNFLEEIAEYVKKKLTQ